MSVGAAVVLAAHGAGDGSGANRAAQRLAHELAGSLGGTRVSVAFQLGTPSFRTVLDELGAAEVTVVPLLTSDGFFARERLVSALAENHTAGAIRLRITPPVGLSPQLRAALLARTARTLAALPRGAAATSLLAVGHGTPASPTSGEATFDLARALAAAFPAALTRAAFLDQEPRLEAVLDTLDRPQLVVLPFLFGGGRHAAEDLPRAVHGRAARVVIEPQLSEEPAVLAVVRELVAQIGRRRVA